MTQIPRKGKIRQIYIYIYIFMRSGSFFFAKILRFSIPRNTHIPVVKFYDSKEDFLLLSLFVCLEFRRNKNSQKTILCKYSLLQISIYIAFTCIRDCAIFVSLFSIFVSRKNSLEGCIGRLFARKLCN